MGVDASKEAEATSSESKHSSPKCGPAASPRQEIAPAPAVSDDLRSDADDEADEIGSDQSEASPPPTPQPPRRRGRRKVRFGRHVPVATSPPAESPKVDTATGFCMHVVPTILSECAQDPAAIVVVVVVVLVLAFLLGYSMGEKHSL